MKTARLFAHALLALSLWLFTPAAASAQTGLAAVTGLVSDTPRPSARCNRHRHQPGDEHRLHRRHQRCRQLHHHERPDRPGRGDRGFRRGSKARSRRWPCPRRRRRASTSRWRSAASRHPRSVHRFDESHETRHLDHSCSGCRVVALDDARMAAGLFDIDHRSFFTPAATVPGERSASGLSVPRWSVTKPRHSANAGLCLADRSRSSTSSSPCWFSRSLRGPVPTAPPPDSGAASRSSWMALTANPPPASTTRRDPARSRK